MDSWISTAVDGVGPGLGDNLHHVQIALPVVTGDINSGDVGGLVRCQKLEQGRESDALRALLVLRSQLGHGFKGPAAVAGHTDAYTMR